MNKNISKKLSKRKRRVLARLKKANSTKYRKAASGAGPELAQNGLKYELSDKILGTVHSGISMMVALAQKLGLTEAIDRRLDLLKFHLPYHESDHVMNFAINALCGGTCLEDIGEGQTWGHPVAPVLFQ